MTARVIASPEAPHDARVRPHRETLHTRLLGQVDVPGESRWRGWWPLLVITAFGGLLRFWRLDQPHKLVFDEVYYVKEGWSLFLAGYELRNNPAITKPDNLFTAGTPNVFTSVADFVVHPPLGKWLIGAGMWLFGPTSSWGWRVSVATAGTLSILMLGRIARRLFRSTLLGGTAALLLAVEGEHFVQSRTSLLDPFLMFFALAGYGCLLVDRDAARSRLAHLAQAPPRGSTGPWGPRLGVRWWRLLAGFCLGLACGVKWSGLYFLAVFGVMTVLWDLAARRTIGVPRYLRATLVRDVPGAVLSVVPVSLLAYLLTWSGWFATAGGFDRNWGAQHPSRHFGLVPDALRGLWRYHQDAYRFHLHLTSPHPYKSNPWSWLVQSRPTAFFWGRPATESGCAPDRCQQAITSLGTPVIWWGATFALAVVVFFWAFARDWRAGAVLAGLAGGYLPWFQYQQRTIFTFYTVAFAPWVVLTLTYALGRILGPPDATPQRRRLGAVLAGAVVVAAMVNFLYFYPIYTAETISYTGWLRRMWLPSWI